MVSSSNPLTPFTAHAGVIGDGKPFEVFAAILVGLTSSSSLISSGTTTSLLGAGVKLWLDPRLVPFFKCPLIGKAVVFCCGILATGICEVGVFLKKPAIEVWFFELDVDFLREAGGAGVPLGVFAEGVIARLRPRMFYRLITYSASIDGVR